MFSVLLKVFCSIYKYFPTFRQTTPYYSKLFSESGKNVGPPYSLNLIFKVKLYY